MRSLYENELLFEVKHKYSWPYLNIQSRQLKFVFHIKLIHTKLVHIKLSTLEKESWPTLQIVVKTKSGTDYGLMFLPYFVFLKKSYCDWICI